MDLGREHLEPEPLAKRCGGAVFRNRLDKDQQCAYGIVSAYKRQEDFAKPARKARSEHRPGFFKTGRDIQHGVFKHGQHEREYMKAHDDNKSAQRKEPLFTTSHCGDKLL